MPIVRIQTVQADLEPQTFEVPDGFMPEFVHEVAKLKERSYRHEHFKTAVSIDGAPAEKWLAQQEEPLPVSNYVLKKNIEQVALRLVDGQEQSA